MDLSHDTGTSDKVWVAHPTIDGEWLPALVSARHDDNTVTVRSDDGTEVKQKADVRQPRRGGRAPSP